jgi:hypothetical protein
MNTFLYGVFISPHGGLGGPPSFLVYYVQQIRCIKIVLQITNLYLT